MKDKKALRPKKVLIILLALVTIILIFTVLELLNVTHVFHASNKETTTANSGAKGESANSPNNSSSSSNDSVQTQQPGDDKNTIAGADSIDVIEPSGNFVSNHLPNLNGTPAPNQIQSNCNTNPGATCKISFTKDGITKSLPAQQTDRGGSTYWTWTLQEVGLTEGDWTIQATATLNGASKSAQDALKLQVRP